MVGANLKFENRYVAGQELAQKLKGLRLDSALIFAVPRGGLPLGRAIAEEFGSMIDIAPSPESETAQPAEFSSLTADNLQTQSEGLDVSGREVVLVDDVIATGAITAAAVRMLTSRGATRLVVASAVMSKEARLKLKALGAEVAAIHLLDQVESIVDHFIDDALPSEKEVQETRALARTSRKVGRASAGHTSAAPSTREVPIQLGDLSFSAVLHKPMSTQGVVIVLKSVDLSHADQQIEHLVTELQATSLSALVIDVQDQFEDSKRAFENISEIAQVLRKATDWLAAQKHLGQLPIGYWGFGIGAASIVINAAAMPERARAVITVNGQLGLVEELVSKMVAASLLLVGTEEKEIMKINRAAASAQGGEISLLQIPGSLQVSERAGSVSDYLKSDAFQEMVSASRAWFERYMIPVRHGLAVTPAESEA